MVNPVEALTETLKVTNPSGTAVTAVTNLAGRIIRGIYMPIAWTAANLTFQASYDGSADFVPMARSR